jgi:hypothetical protein
MTNFDKLAAIAKGMLKTGENFDDRDEAVAGKTVVKTSAGHEIVDGFFAATNHRVLVVINATFGGRRKDSFTYPQVGSVTFNEKENSMTLCTPGESFTLLELGDKQNPKKFVEFVNEKKTPKRATVDVGVTMKKEK